VISLFNSLTHEKSVFTPIVPGKVKLYVCGVTVYDYCHVGHARVFVVFDAFVRLLKSLNYDVTYIRNITDIDDKIIKRAGELNEPVENLTNRFIDAMHEDETALLCDRPSMEPRAMQYVAEMQNLISSLIEKDAAYVADNGDVLFAVHAYEKYGELSRQTLAHLRSGCRVEVSEAKRDPLDFVLWKKAKPGEPAWESPWGEGRPGWHIECSAMALKNLGETFDLHGGGFDLKFPHHENERAQSEASTGKTFVNSWMHVGFVEINQEKMAKSLGNFFTVRDVLKNFKGEVIRFFLLSTHYRSPLPFSMDSLKQAEETLKRLYGALNGCVSAEPVQGTEAETEFHKALADDFNTPLAFASLFELVKTINREKEAGSENANAQAALLKKLGGVLGLLQDNPEHFFKGNVDEAFAEKVEQMILARNAARAAKDFAKADAIRDEFVKMGVVLEDGKGGTTWRRQ